VRFAQQEPGLIEVPLLDPETVRCWPFTGIPRILAKERGSKPVRLDLIIDQLPDAKIAAGAELKRHSINLGLSYDGLDMLPDRVGRRFTRTHGPILALDVSSAVTLSFLFLALMILPELFQ
jgi:hypothetical protein